MKKHIFKVCLAFVAITVLFGACQKDTGSQNNPSTVTSKYKKSTPEEINDVRNAFAKTLSRAIYDAKLRKYVHERMRERLQTDYEMVYIAEKNKVIYDGKTLAQILTSYAEKEVLAKYGNDFFDKVTDMSPLLSITMPELEKWDAMKWDVNYVPKVAAVLENTANNSKSFTIYGGSNSTTPTLRNEDELQDPTLGVWDAESTYLVDEDGYTTEGIEINDFMPVVEGRDCESIFQRAQDALNLYTVNGIPFYLTRHNVLIAQYEICLGGGNTGGGGNPCTLPCERDCETLDETLVSFKINGWSVFTNIRNQLFETRYVFHGDIMNATRNTFGIVSPFTAKFVSPSLKKGDLLNCSGVCDGRWQNANFRIFRDWNLKEFGEPYKVDWAEVDNGTTTASLSFPMSVKFKVDAVEVNAGITPSISRVGSAIVSLGNSLVFYCDPTMMENNTGSVSFRCN